MTVKSKKLTATGEVHGDGATVLGIHIVQSATAGSVTLKDGGGSGTTKLDLDTPAVAGSHYVPVPGGGIAHGTDVHATLTNVDSITVIFEDVE